VGEQVEAEVVGLLVTPQGGVVDAGLALEGSRLAIVEVGESVVVEQAGLCVDPCQC